MMKRNFKLGQAHRSPVTPLRNEKSTDHPGDWIGFRSIYAAENDNYWKKFQSLDKKKIFF